ncbi:hypothetical protein THAOC_17887, partial [Thalassiosira oceanica]
MDGRSTTPRAGGTATTGAGAARTRPGGSHGGATRRSTRTGPARSSRSRPPPGEDRDGRIAVPAAAERLSRAGGPAGHPPVPPVRYPHGIGPHGPERNDVPAVRGGVDVSARRVARQRHHLPPASVSISVSAPAPNFPDDQLLERGAGPRVYDEEVRGLLRRVDRGEQHLESAVAHGREERRDGPAREGREEVGRVLGRADRRRRCPVQATAVLPERSLAP